MKKIKHIESFDALRGVFSFLILMGHAQATYFIMNIDQQLRVIVLFFFVLSGYVISLNIHKNIKRNGSFVFSEYAAGRFFRIMPPLMATVVFFAILYHVLKAVGLSLSAYNIFEQKIIKFEANWFLQLKSLLTLTLSGNLPGNISGRVASNGALWSLVCEIRFYAIFGLASFLLYSKRAFLLKTVALIALLLFIDRSFSIRSENLFLNVNHISFFCFVFGGLAYFFSSKVEKKKGRFFLLSLYIASMCLYFSEPWGDINCYNALINQTIMGFCFALAVPILSELKAPKILKRMGDISYSLYIVHVPICTILSILLFRLLNGTFIYNRYFSFVIIVLFSVLFSWAFSWIFERPREHKELVIRIVKKAKKKQEIRFIGFKLFQLRQYISKCFG